MANPVKQLLVVAVLLDCAATGVIARCACGVQDDVTTLKAFLDFDTEQQHVLIYAAFPLNDTIGYPSIGILTIGILPETGIGKNRE